jgi:ComF family protein
MQALKKIFQNTAHMFYPHVCTGCGSDILPKENLLCARCLNNLPVTGFAFHPGNPVEEIFWGRLNLKAAHSEYYFDKDALIQHLVHQLKYKSNQSIGLYLGEMMGKTLISSKRFDTIDAIIPLPLYAEKERKRGYNQAAIICNGMSQVMNIPVITNKLLRQRYTETQTKKHRTERWENVEGSFIINDPDSLKGKHLLLIDDVVTTGATLDAAGIALLKISSVSLSIATLTIASR